MLLMAILFTTYVDNTMRRRYLGSGEEKIDLSKPYFAIEALEDGLEVKFHNSYEYCIDDGIWKKGIFYDKHQINAGQSLYIRATLTPKDNEGIGDFLISGRCNLSGNIMSLLFGDDFEEQTDLTGYKYAFSTLFKNCRGVVDASNLILPATTLVESCYQYMFSDCTSLTTAPELPATTLAKYCYSSMFMGCSKLKYIKMLATDISADYCLHYWVNGVSNTGTFVKNKDATWNVTGDDGIPSRWTVQTA